MKSFHHLSLAFLCGTAYKTDLLLMQLCYEKANVTQTNHRLTRNNLNGRAGDAWDYRVRGASPAISVLAPSKPSWPRGHINQNYRQIHNHVASDDEHNTAVVGVRASSQKSAPSIECCATHISFHQLNEHLTILTIRWGPFMPLLVSFRLLRA